MNRDLAVGAAGLCRDSRVVVLPRPGCPSCTFTFENTHIKTHHISSTNKHSSNSNSSSSSSSSSGSSSGSRSSSSMRVCLYACLSGCMCVCVSGCVADACLSVCVSVRLRVRVYVRLCVRVSVRCVSLWMPVCVDASVRLRVCSTKPYPLRLKLPREAT